MITAQVGGGFGGKAGIHAEYSVVAAASRLTGRPVQWVPPRSDDMKALPHSRGQVQYVELGCTSRRHVHRAAGSPRRRRRRLPDDRRLPARRHTPHVAGHVQLRHDRVRHRRGGDQHHADGCVPRRRPTGGDRAPRARRRPGRPRTRHRPDRDPQEELPRRRRLPVHDHHGQHLRQRQVLAAARPCRRTRRLRRAARRAATTARGRRSRAARHRRRRVRRDHRRRWCRRVRSARGARRRIGDGLRRHPQPRSGSSDRVRDAGLRSDRHPDRSDHARRRRHRSRAHRWRHRRLTVAPARRIGRPRCDRGDGQLGEGAWPLGCSKPTSPTSSSTRRPARSASPVCRRRRSPGATSPVAPPTRALR